VTSSVHRRQIGPQTVTRHRDRPGVAANRRPGGVKPSPAPLSRPLSTPALDPAGIHNLLIHR